ncbi:MAG: flagellar hook-basal body complex protein FliE [Spirochaetales bacterium]|nr:flagellar hook-basal body complex protein FliE [Spirochaetales bacterium]
MMPDFYTFDRISRESFTLTQDSVNTLKRLMEKDYSEETPKPESSFGQLLMKALGDVNAEQTNMYALTEQLRTDPDSINIHDLTIASAKANLSLSMTKELLERGIRAYKEIINVR